MVFIRPLSESLQKKAIKELNEVPERIPGDIQTVREWILKQPHLKGRTDDQFLITFLRGSKFSLERAKEKYDLFYTVRSAIPELFTNRDPQESKLAAVLKSGGIVPLTNAVPADGSRHILIKMAAFNPDTVPLIEVVKLYFLINDILIKEDDNFAISGVKAIFDYSNFPKGYITQITPTLMKKFVVLSQEASPLRLKSLIHINTPSAMEAIINVGKGFLNEKNRSRVIVYGSKYEELFKDVPKKLLPTEYGGEAGSMKDLADRLVIRVNDCRNYILEESNYGTDEKKRPGKPKDTEALFGVEGSFRQLNVD